MSRTSLYVIVFIGAIIIVVIVALSSVIRHNNLHNTSEKYDIALPIYNETHIHINFLMVINDIVYDFSSPHYQSTDIQKKSRFLHLHDNVGHIIHIHAYNRLLSNFFSSIGFTITDECIITDTQEKFCANSLNSLSIYVNGTKIENITEYQFTDIDRVLIIYGSYTEQEIESYLKDIEDDACIQSDRCRDRGRPLPESGCAVGGKAGCDE